MFDERFNEIAALPDEFAIRDWMLEHNVRGYTDTGADLCTTCPIAVALKPKASVEVWVEGDSTAYYDFKGIDVIKRNSIAMQHFIELYDLGYFPELNVGCLD